jgi:hypothetical protein
MTVFGSLLDIVQEVIISSVSERDYHQVVECMEVYATIIPDRDDEQLQLQIRGWPLSYHPCNVMENIRFAVWFNKNDNVRLQGLMALFSKQCNLHSASYMNPI